MSQAHSFGLEPLQIEAIRSVFRKHPSIEKVLVYGSRARGNFKPNSDIDLTIVGESVDTTELLKIENELDDLLLAYKIDLSLFHQIENSDLVDHIKKVGRTFYLRG